MQLLEIVRTQVDAVLAEYTANHAEHARRVSQTRDAALGDYQANVIFALSKELNQNPETLANEIASKLQESELFERVDVAGKGFINMRLAEGIILDQCVIASSDGRCGVATIHPCKKYVVDFSSPNVAKPMHVGHIRSTVIGDAINRTLRFMGHEVITDNHLGDWGTQFGMIIFGYKNFVDVSAYDSNPVAELSRLYRLVQQLISYQNALGDLPKLEAKVSEFHMALGSAEQASQAQPKEKSLEKSAKAARRRYEAAIEELNEARSKIESVSKQPDLLELSAKYPNVESASLRETALMHESDPTNLALWQKFMPHCLASIQQVYDVLNVQFDYQLGESFYHDRLAKVVELLRDKNLLTISEGAACVFLKSFDAPMIVQKKDGAYLYATTDLATVQYRVEQFDPDSVLYVVDHRQSEHFQKFFEASQMLGYELDLRHISFGTVLGKDGKPFKTRSGDVVGLESLLQEAVDRARAVVCNPDRLSKAALQMDALEQDSIATTVGLGAIKYADLSHNRTSDYEFDLEKMVQLEGNTAAYIQYSYARTNSILRKIEAEQGIAIDAIPDSTQIAFSHASERSLAMQLLRFEDAIRGSLEDFQPSFLADYLFETARQFASFFDQCPVLRAESEQAATTRRLLVNLTGQILKQGLELLGIGVVERM